MGQTLDLMGSQQWTRMNESGSGGYAEHSDVHSDDSPLFGAFGYVILTRRSAFV